MQDYHISSPWQTIILSTRGNIKQKFSKEKTTKDNLMAMSWHMPVSFNPFLYAISISKERYSYNLIKESKVFAVNFIPFRMAKEAVFCGSRRGEFIDKFKEGDIKKEECERIDCPRLKDAAAVLECQVIAELDAGDHQLIVGKVMNAIKKKDEKRCLQLEKDFTTTK